MSEATEHTEHTEKARSDISARLLPLQGDLTKWVRQTAFEVL